MVWSKGSLGLTNATAVLCILEMDSAMLAADEEQIKDQLCAAAYKFLQQTISRRQALLQPPIRSLLFLTQIETLILQQWQGCVIQQKQQWGSSTGVEVLMGMLVPNSTNCFSVLGSAAEPVEPPPQGRLVPRMGGTGFTLGWPRTSLTSTWSTAH
eukprot:EG_transcript_36269